jgi:hypothetical protein
MACRAQSFVPLLVLMERWAEPAARPVSEDPELRSRAPPGESSAHQPTGDGFFEGDGSCDTGTFGCVTIPLMIFG